MPQLPRQFAPSSSPTQIGTGVPQNSEGQGYGNLGQGLQSLGTGLARFDLSNPINELVLAQAEIDLDHALNDLRATFKDADDFRTFREKMRESVKATQDSLVQDVASKANSETAGRFLKLSRTLLTKFDADVLAHHGTLQETEYAVRYQHLVDSAITEGNQEKLQQALSFAKTHGILTGKAYADEEASLTQKLKAEEYYRRMDAGDFVGVVNDVEMGVLRDKGLKTETIEAIETEAKDTQMAREHEEDRVRQQTERAQKANLTSLQFKFEEAIYGVLTIDESQVPEGSTIAQVQLAQLDDIERSFARRTQSINAETGNIIVAVPQDLVSANRDRIVSLRNQIVQGRTAESEAAYQKYNGLIDNTLTFEQAAQLRRRMDMDPYLSPDHNGKLTDAIRAVTNNVYKDIMDEQDRRIQNLLELDPRTEARVMEGQLATQIAKDEYHQWVRANMGKLKSGEVQFTDGVRPIVNRTRVRLGELLRVRAEHIKPFIMERLAQYQEQVSLIATLGELPPELQNFTPQDMVLREVASGRLTAAEGQREIAWLDLMQVSGGVDWTGTEGLKAGPPETGTAPPKLGGTTFKEALTNAGKKLQEFGEAFQRMVDEQMQKFSPMKE